MKSKINVYQFHKSNSVEWDTFVSCSSNGTLFHKRSFLGYHIDRKIEDHSLILKIDEKIISVFPAAVIYSGSKKILYSHPGATIGGFVTKFNPSLKKSFDLVESLVHYAKNENFFGIRVTLPLDCYSDILSNYLEFAMLNIGFTYLKREVSSIMFFSDTIGEAMKGFKPSHRQAIRKAEREGVKIRQSTDFETFYGILKNNLSKRHGVTPTHSLKELELLNTIFPQKIVLYAAFLNDKMIAGVVSFILNKRIELAFYISHDEKYQEKRALNLLFYRIFEKAIQNKTKVFDFGIFTENEKPNFGLARFKENFGARGVFRNTIQFKL